MTSLDHFTIGQLHQAIEQGDISASEIATTTLEAIEQANPVINAYTHITRERLLNEAAAVDKTRASGMTLPPLAGIPYAVKNLLDVAGEVTLAGASLNRHNAVACHDAWTISRLSAQGAMLSGMLNMDAYAYGFTTENSHYGATRNPRDLTRIAGGSSGGSAAAVAAGLVHFTLGSDTNGSIRVPSSLSGILGLKPTFGRLSRRGSQPFVASLDHLGPMARCSEDLSYVYDAIQGRDPHDHFQADQPTRETFSQLSQGQHGLRIAMLGGYFSTWCDDHAKTAVLQVAQALRAQDEIDLPQAELARTAAFIISASEGGNLYLPKLRSMPEQFEPLSRERLLAGAMIPAAWYVQAQRFRQHFQQQVLPLFDQWDILIAPATPSSATLIGQETLHINGHDLPTRANMGMLTQPISFLGLPVVTVPVTTANGLPIGLQLIAPPWREDLCLRAAWALEQQGIVKVSSSPVVPAGIVQNGIKSINHEN
ncbi:AtzE family amidohydrolase [Acerihabitans sp. TG2]|uniref:AtzE family amidohydrolase n=1 Tax=Acerihabitans sp. TG2 TaxID=3096008 RepID=UPI002B23DDF9|nr:AtzE family amidohydrolase [Acerihabitans sp. TG2]MEA9389706.1 AtzE family amidohydrolase [Acerihabitans sp. TG2]